MTDLRTRYILKIHTEFDTTIIPGYYTQETALAVVKAVEAGLSTFAAHIKDINSGQLYALAGDDEWEEFEV